MVGLLLMLLLILCVVLVSVIIALYLVPVEISATLICRDGACLNIIVRWCILLFFYGSEENGETGISIFGYRMYRRVAEEKRVEKKPPKETVTRVMDLRNALKNIRKFMPYMGDIISLSVRSLRLTSLRCDMRIGFGDAPLTGQVYGYIQALKGALTESPKVTCSNTPLSGVGVLPPIEKFRLDVEPEFGETLLEGETSLSIAVEKPLLFILPAIRIFRQLRAMDGE